MAKLIWTLGLAGGLGLLIVAAAGQSYSLHTLIAAVSSFAIAIMAIRENERQIRSSAQVYALASTNARYMGLVWAWGLVALLVQYTTVIHWREWWQFAVVFGAAAILCLAFSNLLMSSAKDRVRGERVLRISRMLAIVQLVGMIVTVLGLIIDGKMRFQESDWAANNVFFYGAAALGVISAVSLRSYNRLLKEPVPSRPEAAVR